MHNHHASLYGRKNRCFPKNLRTEIKTGFSGEQNQEAGNPRTSLFFASAVMIAGAVKILILQRVFTDSQSTWKNIFNVMLP